MRKFSIVLLLGALLMSVSCRDFADLYERIDQLEGKVGELEKLQLAELSNTVNGLSTTVGQLEKKVYVESVTETDNGYVIKFTDGKTATIKDGEDGEDGTTPTIGVKDEDGVLVWTVNGDVVKDAHGKSVPASVQVPEFKFENNKWWYRFGDKDQWKDCGEKTGPEPSITETDDYVIISIGDKKVQIPKEVVSPAIEDLKPVITIAAKRLFVPVGGTLDLKDWFTVEPEGALKTMVDYTYSENAPFTVSEKGILNVTGAGNYTVTVSAKVNPDLKTDIAIRSAEVADSQEPQSLKPEQMIQIYEGSLEEYNKQIDFGGTTSFNPANGAIAGIFNGTLNFRIGMPVTPNTNITKENGRLHFLFYVADPAFYTPANLEGNNFLEHTSSGTYDADEIDFDLTSFVPNFKKGWNVVDLKLSDAAPNAGNYDPTKASFIRFLCNADTKGAWAAYQMKDLYVYAGAASVTAINPVIKNRNNIFVPVGSSVDLKQFFTVEPESAGKDNLTYTPAEGAPFSISKDGIVSVTGAGSYKVTVASADKPDVKMDIFVRSAECPDNQEPTASINPAQKVKVFNGSLEEYISAVELGGSSSWNPVNNSHTAITSGGQFNFRLGFAVEQNTNITMENGHLHFMLYVSDASAMQAASFDDTHFLEVTSSGTYDVDEVNFDLPIVLSNLKNGWNEIDLPFSSASHPGGNFDPSKTSFVRYFGDVAQTGKYLAIQIKDIFAYAAEQSAPAKITIDGDLSDWANVKGSVNASEGATYLEFKMASDANNIYFYTKRVANSALWNAGGYLYYALDYDNNPATGTGDIWGNSPYECIFVIWPFAGTGDAPAFAEKPLGESMMKPSGSLANYNANGKADASGVELEFSIPRADFPTIPDSEITVYAWGNKSGENMKNFPLKIKL